MNFSTTPEAIIATLTLLIGIVGNYFHTKTKVEEMSIFLSSLKLEVDLVKTQIQHYAVDMAVLRANVESIKEETSNILSKVDKFYWNSGTKN